MTTPDVDRFSRRYAHAERCGTAGLGTPGCSPSRPVRDLHGKKCGGCGACATCERCSHKPCIQMRARFAAYKARVRMPPCASERAAALHAVAERLARRGLMRADPPELRRIEAEGCDRSCPDCYPDGPDGAVSPWIMRCPRRAAAVRELWAIAERNAAAFDAEARRCAEAARHASVEARCPLDADADAEACPRRTRRTPGARRVAACATGPPAEDGPPSPAAWPTPATGGGGFDVQTFERLLWRTGAIRALDGGGALDDLTAENGDAPELARPGGVLNGAGEARAAVNPTAHVSRAADAAQDTFARAARRPHVGDACCAGARAD